VVQGQDEFTRRRAQIIWVLEEGPNFEEATVDECVFVMETLGATEGWCVGDAETEPLAHVFDDSPFSNGNGFLMFVPTSTMEVAYAASQGGHGAQDNLRMHEMIDALDQVLAEIP